MDNLFKNSVNKFKFYDLIMVFFYWINNKIDNSIDSKL